MESVISFLPYIINSSTKGNTSNSFLQSFKANDTVSDSQPIPRIASPATVSKHLEDDLKRERTFKEKVIKVFKLSLTKQAVRKLYSRVLGNDILGVESILEGKPEDEAISRNAHRKPYHTMPINR